MPSFSIYGGKAGLYDYGPPGCSIKTNVEKLWREHFVIEDDLLEIATTAVTPECVLKASGHVEKFDDVMVRDSKKQDIFYRCDHMIQEYFENVLAKEEAKMNPERKAEIKKIIQEVETYDKEQLGEIITKFKIKSPKTGNDLEAPIPFNLMF
jgi:glycyl-tRNA synthetase